MEAICAMDLLGCTSHYALRLSSPQTSIAVQQFITYNFDCP